MTETQTPSPLTERIRTLVDEEKISLPPLPDLGMKILGMLEDDRCGAGDVAKLVRHEPAVAATILKMANSAAFGGLKSITELSQAIPRLGLRQVASVVTALLHKGHFRPATRVKQATLQCLWDHAVATAIAARHITGMCGGDPEAAFLAGLLHDVGKLLVLKGVDYLESTPDIEITPVLFSELMGDLHPELGQRILMAWKLPQEVCEVARRHHENQPGTTRTLLLRVQAANAIARQVAAHIEPKPDLRLEEVPAVEHLGLNELELATLLVDLEDELAEAKNLF